MYVIDGVRVESDLLCLRTWSASEMPGSYTDDADEQYILIAHDDHELEVDYARVFAAVSIHKY